ncbi:MAG: hypothetical protein L3J17_02125 [Candidatus Jettenia sp.]|nr:MAG: hypothetical protein L3J17_02125 [Candidatus Jettenia sp.]
MKELTEKAKKFQAFRMEGKGIKEAYALAGYTGKAVSAYKQETRIKNAILTDPQTLKASKKIARNVLLIAKEALETRGEEKSVQDQCIKLAMRIIEGQQDRIDPKKNINLNANVDVDFDQIVDLSRFRMRD